MARFSRIDVVLAMTGTGLVPILYDPDADRCLEVLGACHRGGARVFEFSNRGDGAHEVFRRLHGEVGGAHPDLALGVGSVMDAPAAALYVELGADFVVSPVLDPEMARVCNRRKVAWLPGCGTVTEIVRAQELGAEVVKIFPGAGAGGPEFVKAVMGPCPWSSLMPAGGVEPTEANLRAWFEAGVSCVSMGSRLMVPAGPGRYDLAAIERRTREVLGIIARCRRPRGP